jgi:hypothetical protein
VEYKEIAAKMLKKRKSLFVFASFALFRGYSSGLTCSLCNGFGSMSVANRFRVVRVVSAASKTAERYGVSPSWRRQEIRPSRLPTSPGKTG